jgi:S-adenosylmethionine hydrolase
VTLTSDFGTVDGYVGAMKGVLASLAPAAILIDITHEVPRHDIVAGSYALATAAPHFPSGTIHVAVVDPGVGGTRREVVVVAGGQVFVGPDNGLFDRVAPQPDEVYAIAAAHFRRANASATFRGRDVFAVAAAALARGELPRGAGPPCVLRGGAVAAVAMATASGGVIGTIVHVDRWGNLITNIGTVDLRRVGVEVGDVVVVRIAAREWVDVRLARIYEDVSSGALVCYVGSAGTLEISVREGDAAAQLGGSNGKTVEITRALAGHA